MPDALDRLHARARANPLLQRFTVLTRILLAVGYLPPALVKVQGERFTSIDVSHPIGFFFEAMYRTAAWWQFLGWAQLAASALVLLPRTATVGALLYLPITLNIFIITVALRFTGTPVVTGLMLLACVYLLCWDYDRLRSAARTLVAPAARTARWSRLERGGYVLGTTGALGALLWTRGLAPTVVRNASLVLVLVAAAMVVGAWVRAVARRGARAREAGGERA